MTEPQVTKRIIDKKFVLMTDQEWELYQSICKSYDRPNFTGQSLFSELFESDRDGLILFLKPPKKFTSMEVFLFIMSLFCHQHLREMYSRVDNAVQDFNSKSKLAEQTMIRLEKIAEALETKR